MKYQIKFPQCPYRAKGNSHCSHKGCPGRCPYNKPEKCQVYNDIVKYNKTHDSGSMALSELPQIEHEVNRYGDIRK